MSLPIRPVPSGRSWNSLKARKTPSRRSALSPSRATTYLSARRLTVACWAAVARARVASWASVGSQLL